MKERDATSTRSQGREPEGSTVSGSSGRGHGRGDDHAPADSFLRQKEAQLKEKRERERQREVAQQQQEKDSHNKVTGQLVTKVSVSDPSQPQSQHQTTSVTTPQSKTKVQENSNKVSKRTKEVNAQGGANSLPSNTTTNQHVQRPNSGNRSSNSSVHIPEFYFPMGRPGPAEDSEAAVLQRLKEEFGKMDSGKVDKTRMGPICKVSESLRRYHVQTQIGGRGKNEPPHNVT